MRCRQRCSASANAGTEGIVEVAALASINYNNPTFEWSPSVIL